MNISILREEIQSLLEVITEQYAVIRSYNERIPQIEFDLLIDNVRKLYENLHLLNRSNDPYNFFENRSQKKIPAEPKENITISEKQVNEEEPVKNKKSPVTIHYDDGNGSDNKTEPVIPDIQWQELDLFSPDLSGFSEKLKEARQKSLGPRTRKPRQNDLKGIISINEKFLFINELFDGNLREYNENIDALNLFSDLKSAMDYLDLLRKKSLWNSESTAFIKLKELVEQRFR